LSIAADEKQPVEIRLGACAMAIPVMYPRLSATTVQANHTVTRVDPGELMDKIAQRISRQDATPPLIEHEQPARSIPPRARLRRLEQPAEAAE
jgi:hypothetical protein